MSLCSPPLAPRKIYVDIENFTCHLWMLSPRTSPYCLERCSRSELPFLSIRFLQRNCLLFWSSLWRGAKVYCCIIKSFTSRVWLLLFRFLSWFSQSHKYTKPHKQESLFICSSFSLDFVQILRCTKWLSRSLTDPQTSCCFFTTSCKL